MAKCYAALVLLLDRASCAGALHVPVWVALPILCDPGFYVIRAEKRHNPGTTQALDTFNSRLICNAIVITTAEKTMAPASSCGRASGVFRDRRAYRHQLAEHCAELCHDHRLCRCQSGDCGTGICRAVSSCCCLLVARSAVPDANGRGGVWLACRTADPDGRHPWCRYCLHRGAHHLRRSGTGTGRTIHCPPRSRVFGQCLFLSSGAASDPRGTVLGHEYRTRLFPYVARVFSGGHLYRHHASYNGVCIGRSRAGSFAGGWPDTRFAGAGISRHSWAASRARVTGAAAIAVAPVPRVVHCI
ncbi:MAG: Uncharacterised protein [SAR116 cluster bacterium]|nr:MAG: Uncharacterised protein [SAR116 cluster bacterium]